MLEQTIRDAGSACSASVSRAPAEILNGPSDPAGGLGRGWALFNFIPRSSQRDPYFPQPYFRGDPIFLHGSHPSGGSIVDTPDGSHFHDERLRLQLNEAA
jgi:hypothetical protein